MDDRKPLIPLILALKERRMSQRDLAREIDEPESVVSMTINGKYILNSDTKRKISEILGRPVSVLFPANV